MASKRERWDAVHEDELQETGYWGRAGAGCLFLARDTGRILVAKRSGDVLEPYTWGTWGGAIDPGETPLEAALREASAETGESVDGTEAILLWVYHDRQAGFSFHNYLVTADAEFEPGMGWETADFAWCTVGGWPEPLHYGLEALLGAPEAVARLEEAVGRCAGIRRPGR